ncbi:hypothetical protein THRCLA_02526 [Thraustotheca clavata]|uniref:MIF4G domain-containing protein n=1 Tax=Thraustotheca clavata TaxID=74557 RepID=A0A1W0A4X3_9STRA|nr:hypothetical protein THRCLA_02526 [Thraustotheca clavata]
MTSKLNPNAGAFVPSFSTSIDPVPAPAKARRSGAHHGKTSPPNKAIQLSAPASEATQQPEQTQIGRIINGRQHYTIAELLQFRSICTTPPPDLQMSSIHAGTPKDNRSAKTPKKEKQSNRPMMHYDPSTLPYFKEAGNSTPTAPSKEAIKTTDDPEKETKDALEAFTSILTSSSESWITQVKSVPVTCTSTLQAVVGLLFDRAIAEPNESDHYANLCTSLSESLPEFKDGARTINFRRVLLTKCYEALVEEATNSWRRQCMLNNVVFIGELFRRQLLTENIMHVCVAMMLDSEEDNTIPDQCVLKAACRLLSLVGDLLDGSSPASRRTMDEYFDALQRIACSSTLPIELRPLLQETLEARSNGWPRKRHDATT